MNRDRVQRWRGKMNADVLFVIVLLGGWFLLQGVILPKLGVST